jgi:hypothetical protein
MYKLCSYKYVLQVGLGQIFSNNFLNNRQLFWRGWIMGFSTAQEVLRMRRVCLKLIKFCTMWHEPVVTWSKCTGVNNLTTSPQSLLEVLKAPRTSKTSLMLQYNNRWTHDMLAIAIQFQSSYIPVHVSLNFHVLTSVGFCAWWFHYPGRLLKR